ncbi:putative bifunctional diguanylate cyclase/phosphodiesterase [Microbacterium sp. B2969]|uniref:Bifunctional diguanylate cyclase/phosphodiesterase n=1 Tax=Microbacterium alkaliflavum TaxID=3248839 RepID=A0ABW7Q2C1_9MICO
MNAIAERSARMWWIFLSVCSAGIVVYQLMPSGVAGDLVYVGVGLASAVAIVAGVRLNRPSARSAWYLMAVGVFLSAVADGIFSWIVRVQGEDAFPTLADAFYLAAYPFFAAGLLLLIRARRPLKDLAGFLDSAILTAGLGLVVWVLLAAPTMENHHDSWLAAGVSTAYPVADIVLLGMLIGLITIPGSRSVSLILLVLAIVLLIVVDLAAALLDLLSAPSTSIDALWLASYALWGAAALHTSMRTLSEPAIQADVQFPGTRLAALAVATFVAPVMLILEHLLGLPIDGWPIGIATLVMFALLIARMKIAIDQIAAANRQRIEAQEALAYQAAHDALTDLPNRALAVELITAALSGVTGAADRVALLFLDLDGFKRVNDTLGHDAGDELLRVMAGRLRENVRAGDVACRLGGDEFVILLAPLTDEADAVAVANRLVPVLSAPVTVAGQHDVSVGASIGVAVSRGQGTSPDALLKEADSAVYGAKRSGRGRVKVFDAEMRRELHARTELERDLSRAIERNQLIVHYQPIVHLASGGVQGFEALVRWPRDGRLLPPSAFVPIAEESELVCDLDAWVLRQATRQLAHWNERSGSRWLSMAVNVSGRHIVRPRVVAEVREAVAAAGVDPAQLVLEITETALVDDSIAVKHLDELRHDGIAIGIDDFGTGYSSIARLEDLPIDILKIDRRFTHTTGSSPRLLRMIVETGHALGLRLIVEGVETEDQLALLRSIGCESAQGYLLGRPLDPDAIAAPQQRGAPRLVRAGMRQEFSGS